MKRGYFLVTLLVMTVAFVYVASAFWPFTGRATQTTCIDSDGNNIYVAGNVSAPAGIFGTIRFRADSCSDSSVIEWTCSNNKAVSRQHVCSEGCSNGACINPEPFCRDTDNGNNVDVAGTVTNNSGTFNDACISSTSVNEYSCDGNNVLNTSLTCDYKCENGVCIPKPFSCTDSDGGLNASSAGIAKMSYLAPASGFFDLGVDTCVNNVLREYYCDNLMGMKAASVKCKGICKNQSVQFEGISYSAGFCEPQPLTCTDSDGKDYTNNGTVTATDVYGKVTVYNDKCSGAKKLTEYYCENNATKSEIYTCEDICVSGKCVLRQQTCADSDNGKIFDQKGTVTTVYGSVTDFCLTKKKIAEFYCKNPYKAEISLTTRICTDKCENGVCVGGVAGDSGEGINQ